jgi:hypothetical protein
MNCSHERRSSQQLGQKKNKILRITRAAPFTVRWPHLLQTIFLPISGFLYIDSPFVG